MFNSPLGSKRSWGRRRWLSLGIGVGSLGLLAGLTTAVPPAGAATGWSYGGDLPAQAAQSANGGSAVTDSSNSSFSGATAETCKSDSQCGWGEPGGPDRLGVAQLNNVQYTDESFACPSTATSHTAAPGTTTASSTTSASPPALVLFAGGDVGGIQSNTANDSAAVTCYNPYENDGGSADSGSSTKNFAGVSYPAAAMDNSDGASSACTSTSCTARAGEVLAYIPKTLPPSPALPNGGQAGAACAGKVLAATGASSFSGTASPSNTSEYYDPNPADSTFNSWSPGPNLASSGHIDPSWVTLQDGRVLIAAGLYNWSGSGTNALTDSYDIFDPQNCSFVNVSGMTMHYDHGFFGMAMFQSNGEVLACGGAENPQKNAFPNNGSDCELFNPNAGTAYTVGSTTKYAGTWTVVGSLSTARGSPVAEPLPDGNILMGGGDNSGYTALNTSSEECSLGSAPPTSTACGQDVAYYESDPTYTNAGFTTQFASYSSHFVVGSVAGHPANQVHNGEVLECGGFNDIANSYGVPQTCEYYVAAGQTIPSGMTCNVASGTTVGPAWCNAEDMVLQRAFFSLQELPPLTCPSTGCTETTLGKNVTTFDEAWAMAGYYGDDSTGNYLTRKSVEYNSDNVS